MGAYRMTDAARLAATRRGCLVAWAGFGKTHLIAEAIAKYPDEKRQLVLTHTHAGVASLRSKLRQVGARSNSARVDTIAGWCFQYVVSFPETSGIGGVLPSDAAGWSRIHGAMSKMLELRWVRDIVSTSYSGVYVDEYQDCTEEQHAVVCRLAEFLPCRVLGDPMQGIFEFTGDMVDWDRDVRTMFDSLPELTTPWRWVESNPALGSWLISARKSLEMKGSLDLRDPAVQWRRLPESKAAAAIEKSKVCQEKMACSGSLVAIATWAGQCHNMAKKLSGVYSCVEKVDLDELYDYADRISQTSGLDRAGAVLEFAGCCMSNVSSANKWIANALERGNVVKPGAKYYRQYVSLSRVVAAGHDGMADAVIGAIDEITQVEGCHVYRRELLSEMRHSLREYATGRFSSLREAAWHARNATRQVARTPRGKLLGRTLLVKGLEFEHAVVLDAEQMDARNLYVAITRGSRSLTVLARQPVLTVQPRK